jgi:hypothetical protein
MSLTHAFFAERRVAKLPEIDGIEPLRIEPLVSLVVALWGWGLR